MIKRILIVAALILVPTAASAQSLKHATGAFIVGATCDWITTFHNISDGAHEQNPLLYGIGHDKAIPTVLPGIALDAAGVFAWKRFIAPKHPKLAAVGLYAAAGFRVYLVFHNLLTTTPPPPR